MDYSIDKVISGTTTAALLEELGIERAGCKAVWYGYPQAVFVRDDCFDDELDVTAPFVRAYGADSCMADALAAIVEELRVAEECTCIFGHEGGFQLAAILGDGCAKRGKPNDIELLRDLAPTMAAYATCDSGKALGRAVQQALDLFPDEIGAHFEKRQCPTGGCAAFKTFHILVSKCTGCGSCLEACEDGAIAGKAKFVHVVDQNKCTQCGRCLDACPEGAVVRAGAKKPKTPPRPIPVKR